MQFNTMLDIKLFSKIPENFSRDKTDEEIRISNFYDFQKSSVSNTVYFNFNSLPREEQLEILQKNKYVNDAIDKALTAEIYENIASFREDILFTDEAEFIQERKAPSHFTFENIINNWPLKESNKKCVRAGTNDVDVLTIDSLKVYKHNAKELLIVDRYFLSNIRFFKTNIKMLIENLINPTTETINILILIGVNDIKVQELPDRKNNTLLEKLNLLSDSVKQVLPNYKLDIYWIVDEKFTINKTGSQFEDREHSRLLFTKQLCIKSGQGFSLFFNDTELNQSYKDQVDIMPFFFEGNKINLNDLKAIKKRILENDATFNFIDWDLFKNI